MNFAPNASRLLAYSSFAIGSTALLATHADAAIIVDVNSATFDTTLSSIGTVSKSVEISGDYRFQHVSFTGVVTDTVGNWFHRASDNDPTSSYVGYGTTSVPYAKDDLGNISTEYDAVLNSSDNWFYAIGESDNSQRVWLQFQFGDGQGNGFSIVKAVYPEYEGELPSPFSAANAGAIPEPSALALLALGAGGLLARRRRSAA